MHIATHIQASNKYPAIYDKGNAKANKSTVKIGFEAWSFAVAESGINGTIEKVNNMYLWEFIETLDYLIKKQK